MYQRSTTKHETGELTSQTEALAAMVRMLDELDNDGLTMSCGIYASPVWIDGELTGDRLFWAWVEVSADKAEAAT